MVCESIYDVQSATCSLKQLGPYHYNNAPCQDALRTTNSVVKDVASWAEKSRGEL